MSESPSPRPNTGCVGQPVLQVLHVEDSQDDHDLVVAHLRRGGLAVRIHRVDSADQFKLSLDRQPWDIILSDYRLPGFGGMEALAILRSTGLLIPFIILSGEIGEDTAVEAMRQGASDYLLKGRTARLVPAIERALETAQAQRERARTAYELAESRERLSALAQHLQSSIEEERAAMAREIHDEVGSTLAALKFDLAWIERNTTQTALADRARQAQDVLQQAMSTAQRLMLNLRPAILDQGLAPALHWLCCGFRERHGTACVLRMSQELPAIPPDVAMAAFRTVQEALNNVSKHARAQSVTVDVIHAADMLSIEISDDGRGWTAGDLEKPRSFGLRGLQERALTVGGWLDLTSSPSGSSLILSVPLPVAAGAEPSMRSKVPDMGDAL